MTWAAGRTGPDPARDRMLTAVTGDGRDPAMLDATDVRDAIDLLRHVISSVLQAGALPGGRADALGDMAHRLDSMPPGGFADVPSMLSWLAYDMEEDGDGHPPFLRRAGLHVIRGATLRAAVGYITSMAVPGLPLDDPVLAEAMALAACRGLTYIDRGVIVDAAALGTGRMLHPKSDPETLVSLSAGPLGGRLLDSGAVIDKAHATAMIEADATPAAPCGGTPGARLCAGAIAGIMKATGMRGLPVGDDDDGGKARMMVEKRAASNVRAGVCADVFRAMAWLYGPDMRRAFRDLDVNGQRGAVILKDGGDGAMERWLAEDMGGPAPFASEDAMACGVAGLCMSR